MLHEVTKGYQGLQRAKRSYKWLLGVTGGYKGFKGLQEVTGVTRSYREVTGDYKGLQVVTGGFLQAVFLTHDIYPHPNPRRPPRTHEI